MQLYKESGIAAAFFANRAPSSTHRWRRGLLTYNPFFEASYEKGFSPLQTLFSVVTLDRLGLDDHGRVGFLPVLAFGGDCSGDVARTQPESNRYACHNRRGYGNNDFVNLLLCHNNLTV